MRMSLRLREREARRSRYLDMSPVEPGRQPGLRMWFAASRARRAEKLLFRHSPGRTSTAPQSARYANEFIYILTNHLFTH